MSLRTPVTDHDHAAGSKNAPLTLVEYGDYQCPHCAAADPVVRAVQKDLGADLRFVFRNFPLAEMHPYAMGAAEVAEAAGMQGKFWEMHDRLYENQDTLDSDNLMEHVRALHLDPAKIREAIRGGKVDERIKADFNGGVRSGVNGTPSFFINGVRFDGDWTQPEQFAEAIAAAGG